MQKLIKNIKEFLASFAAVVNDFLILQWAKAVLVCTEVYNIGISLNASIGLWYIACSLAAVMGIGMVITLNLAIEKALKGRLSIAALASFFCVIFIIFNWNFTKDGVAEKVNEGLKKPTMDMAAYNAVDEKYAKQLGKSPKLHDIEVYNAKIASNNAEVSRLRSELQGLSAKAVNTRANKQAQIAHLEADNRLQNSYIEKTIEANKDLVEAYNKSNAIVLREKEKEIARVKAADAERNENFSVKMEKNDNKAFYVSSTIFGLLIIFTTVLNLMKMPDFTFSGWFSLQIRGWRGLRKKEPILANKTAFLKAYTNLSASEKQEGNTAIALKLRSLLESDGLDTSAVNNASLNTYICEFKGEGIGQRQRTNQPLPKEEASQPLTVKNFSGLDLEKDAGGFNFGKK